MFKVILFLLLIGKTTLGFGLSSMISTSSHDCCATTVEICEDITEDNNEDEQKNCCSENCHCTCCYSLALFSDTASKQKSLSSEGYTKPLISYNFDYKFSFIYGIWQPPRLV